MMEKQMKNLAWNTFKQTGNIDTFMELMQVQNMEKNNINYRQKNVTNIKFENN